MADNDWDTDQSGTMDTDIDGGLGEDQGSSSQHQGSQGGQKRRKGRKGGQVDRGTSTDTDSGTGSDTGKGSGIMDDFSEE